MDKKKYIKESTLKKNLLVDFNQYCYRARYNKDIQQNGFNINMWKHLILFSIFSIKKEYNIDNVYICCESKSWRYDFFKYYKVKRKEKHKSEGDEYLYFIENINSFLEELKEYFNFKIIKIDGAEGDDIIAVICKYFNTGYINILSSNDKDFNQLHKYNNFFQYDVVKEQFIDVSDWRYLLFHQILKGDSGDSIPNYLSSDDFYINSSTRQKAIMEKSIKEKFNMANNKIMFFDNDLQKDRFKRNQVLIDFDFIPNTLQCRIIEELNKKVEKNNCMKMIVYFTEREMKVLLDMLQKGEI